MGNKLGKSAKSRSDPVRVDDGVGKSRNDLKESPSSSKITMEDFQILKVLGRGAFGKVMLVKKKDDVSQKLYALKSLKKADLVKAHQVEHTTTERYVLERINNPFLIHLSFAFQTTDKLYIVMDYLTGGELFFWLKKHKRFTEGRAKLYMAECVLAIEALHDKNIIHRDLKPENILLDMTGHVKIVDFGLAKGGISGYGAEGGTKTFCGTPEYVSPELVENRGHGKAVDWWALGAILYEMLYTLPPFYDNNVNKMYSRILRDPLKFPKGVSVSESAKDLIRKMLERNVDERLGSRGANEVKNAPFFSSLNLQKVLSKEYTPEFIPPKDKKEGDVRNFDEEFTTEKPVDSLVVTDMTGTMLEKTEFKGFTYQS